MAVWLSGWLAYLLTCGSSLYIYRVYLLTTYYLLTHYVPSRPSTIFSMVAAGLPEAAAW